MRKNSRFKRLGDDLMADVRVSLSEARPMGTTCWEDVTGFHGWDGIQWDGMRRLMVGIWLGNATVTIVTGSGFS